jgi:Nif-specific regulatory protein
MTATDSITSRMVLPPRYQILEVLKETDTTSVYRVFDASHGREEAIKILRDQLPDLQQVVRFRSEFATLATLEHPNIVRVHDFGLLDERHPYFTMEFFAGRRISDYFDGKNWSALYDVILQITSALHHVHRRGIIHLDLKPSNIFVDDHGRAKLMDFGLAAESRQLFDRLIRGTLQYMAPEVLRQDRIDSRADLYAFGMTLYETVTGALPGYGKSPSDVIRMRLDEDIRPASSINPRVPPALNAIIMRLLEKDPRHRFPTAAALLKAVADAAGTTAPKGELLMGGGELYAAPLIGREADVAQLRAAIEEARVGRGGAVILSGPEGMGKSRIVRDVTLRAQLDGARVFCGRCPVNRKTIYAPFFEIFQEMVRAVNPTANAAEEIRRILRPVTGEGRATSPGQKYRLFNRIVQSMQDIHGFLSAVVGSGGSPLIFVIDDLQWADPSSIELFLFLVNEARHSRLLIIAALTTEGSGAGALDPGKSPEQLWEERAAEGELAVIQVRPLDEALVREHILSLLGSDEVDDELVRWMSWESSGIPLNIRRIVDYLIGHDFLRWDLDGWTADMDRIRALRIPGGAASILMERIDAAPREQRDLLQAAAIFGEQCEASQLARLFSRPDEETYAVIRAAVRGGILDSSSDGRVLFFPQIHARDSLYAAMPERQRSELHLRAGGVLEPLLLDGAAEWTGQLAWHFTRGNDLQKGIRYSIEAGDMASRTMAHEEAAEFYEAALESLELAGLDEGKLETREKLADAYYRSSDFRSAMQAYQFLLKALHSRDRGETLSFDSARVMKKIGKILARRSEYDAALSYYHASCAVYEQADRPNEVAELLNRIAWMEKERGDFVEAEHAARRALALVDVSESTPVYGYIKNTLGVIAYSLGDWQQARTLFLEALDRGEQLGSSSLVSVTKTNLGNTLWKQGDWDTALRYYRDNLDQSENDGDLWDLVTSYNNVGIIEYSRGNFAIGAELFERSLRIAEKIGSIESQALALENRGEALERGGRWNEAAAHYERCIRLDGFDESRAARVSVYVPLARLTNKRGDIAKAIELAERVSATAERSRDEDLLAEACCVMAEIERERENDVAVERLLKQALEIFEAKRTIHGLARVHTSLAELCHRQQRLEEAAVHARAGSELSSRLGDRFTGALADRAWGHILELQGEREAAAARFERARTVLEELDSPFELGRLLFDLGVLRDDPEEAAQTIREAVRIFERLGAVHDLDRARGALFRVRPVGRASSTNVVGLYEIVRVINSTLDLEEVLARVLDIAIKRLRAERGMIILIDPITGALRTRVARNIREGSDQRDSSRSPQAIIREVIETGRSIISADALADERFLESESVIADRIRSTLCAPLAIRERIEGAIYVDHRETRHLFSSKDLAFLEAFADQAAIAIQNARLYEDLEEARSRLSVENETLRNEVLVDKHLDSVVGKSEAVSRIQFSLRKAAAGYSTVLLRGESGTGKGLVARIIHNIGPRRNGPFIKFNCAALPETLAESELFGHERGAFTGADRRKLGRFEIANSGTIFLDEIGKVSLAMQAKLLRVVEEKEFERVGGTQTIKTDVKIIAATNLDLERAIEEGAFREDLFYRLNIIPIVLPPLRDRKADIPMLAEHFIRNICRDLGIDNKRLAPGVLDFLVQHSWPGNVRELEATLHRAIVMANDETLTRDDFQSLLPGQTSSSTPRLAADRAPADPLAGRAEITAEIYDNALSTVDRQLIERALSDAGGRIREAARRLGLARNTLKSKMQKYGIEGR